MSVDCGTKMRVRGMSELEEYWTHMIPPTLNKDTNADKIEIMMRTVT